MTEAELKKEIKSNALSGVYYFYGEETFMRDYYAEQVKKRVLEDSMEEFNLHVYTDHTFSTDDIQNAISSYPMMADKKVILFRDTGILTKSEENKDFFAELFDDIPDYAVVLVCERNADKLYAPYKSLKKNAKCVEFGYRNADRLKPWLAKAATDFEKSISASDLSYIVDRCGPSMANLRSEFQKVVAYVGARKEITRKDIDASISFSEEYQIYVLTDAIFERKGEKVFEILKEFQIQSKDMPAQRVLSSIGYFYGDILRARLLLSEGASNAEILDALSGPPYARKKAMAFAQRVSAQHLKAAVSAIKEGDQNAKSGALEEWTALELAVSQIMSLPKE